MQTLQQFIDKWNGKKIDFDNANQGQCVDLYRQYVKDVLGFPQSPALGVNGGAADIWTTYLQDYFTAIKNTPTGVPSPGDIVIWNKRAGGGYGHVAVFVSGDTNGFKSFDQNWRAINVCEITNHTYTNVTGWLTPKTKPEPPTSPEPAQNDWDGVLAHFNVKDAKELVEMVNREFGFLASAREEIKQLTDIFNQRREKLAQNLMTVNDWDEIIVASGRFKGLDEKNQDLQIKLEKEQQAHKQTVLDYQAKLEALSKEMDEMKKRHETQIDNLQAKVDKEIAELKKAKEQYESVSKVIGWFKSIFKKG